MERLDFKPNSEKIPDIEQTDMSVSPVTAEEMDVELQAMKQAVKDQERILELQEQLKPPSKPPEVKDGDVPPPEQPKGVPDGGGKLEPIILQETDIKYESCRNCEGAGRVMFRILECPKCSGSGKVPSVKQNWKSRVVGYRQSESK